jgi:hypothetical protein
MIYFASQFFCVIVLFVYGKHIRIEWVSWVGIQTLENWVQGKEMKNGSVEATDTIVIIRQKRVSVFGGYGVPARPLCILIPWNRVLLEKLTSLYIYTRNSPHFYGTRSFFIVLTRARHLSLSWADSSQSPQFILILSSHLGLGLPNGLFPPGSSFMYTHDKGEVVKNVN